MKKTRKNNKGFTLIELLATIVILGVLMIIAIPMVTQYIASSKRSAFLATAKAYVSSARYSYLNGDYICSKGSSSVSIDTGSGGVVLIPFSQIRVDKSNNMSSFGNQIDLDKSYVIIESDSKGQYTYSVRMVDKGNNGFSSPYYESSLKKKHVKIKMTTEITAAPTAGGSVSIFSESSSSAPKTISATCSLDEGV